jgi:hypothetical protein
MNLKKHEQIVLCLIAKAHPAGWSTVVEHNSER